MNYSYFHLAFVSCFEIMSDMFFLIIGHFEDITESTSRNIVALNEIFVSESLRVLY